MKRVAEDGEWTLFSPDEVLDLHDLYGRKFDEAYVGYEKAPDAHHKTIDFIQYKV
jgi:ribonucleoside-diphosphate reductase alpha chain